MATLSPDIDKPGLDPLRDTSPLTELDLVELVMSVTVDGRTLPAGSLGVIVGLWAGGRAFEVEFSVPFEILITASADMLQVARDRVR